MGRNSVPGCLRFGCFSSKNHEPSSPDKLYDSISSSSSSDSEKISHREERVPSFKLAPLLRQQRAYPRHAVGINDQVSRVIQLLQLENDTNAAVAVVLHGLGGTGKTTLADAVVAAPDIQGWDYSTVVSVTDQGEIQEEQRQLQALFIYMDNVMVPGEHLQKLLPNCKKLRLLVTARDEMVADVISGCGCGIRTHLYAIRPLPFHDARELLCDKMGVTQAGTMQIPSQINEILKICDGVPLVLERVGAYICQTLDKDEAYRRVIEWSEDGNPFSSAQEHSIEENGLIFDLDELTASAKEAFLDICSFFNGWDRDKVSCITGEHELNSLQKRALFLEKEECENKVMVRPIVLTIARKMTKGKRFTSPHDLSKVLEGNEPGDIAGIKGIWLQDNVSQPFLISATKLDLMQESLRVLALGDMAIVVDGQCSQKFKQMIYLQAGLIPCLPFHPTTPQELRVLDCRLLDNNTDGLQLAKMSSKLKVLKLDGDLYNHPFEIANAFQRLRGLRTLKLAEFKELKILPDELLLLTQLEELDLSGCKKLVQLPVGLGNLTALTKLSLADCWKLKKLPESFGKLRVLKYLNLFNCGFLKKLPEDFGSLSSLEELDLGSCTRLEELPNSFGKLSSLKVLFLQSCTSLRYLPDDIINLSALVRIEFLHRHVVNIPCMYAILIKNLSFERCKQLTNLPERLIDITCLRTLNLSHWSSLERLPEGFSQLKSLAKLNLNDCCLLQQLSTDFHCLVSLETLEMQRCIKLEGKWIDALVNIKTLYLVDIMESEMLIKRWAEMEMEKGQESWQFAVRTVDPKKWQNEENIWNDATSKLLSEECFLTDFHGEPFSLSTIAPDTLLLVLYHHPCHPLQKHEQKLLEEVVKHDHPPAFQMIYAGKYSGDLSKSVAERMMKYASVGSAAYLFLKKAFNVKIASSNAARGSWSTTVVGDEEGSPTVVVTRVVADEEGRKHFSSWEDITHQCERYLLPRSGLYSDLLKLTEQPQESNVKLLRALFDSEGSRTSSIFLRNYTENVRVDQLHGKTVLLLISAMVEHPFQTLKDIYLKLKINDDIEILSIPIPAEVQGIQERPQGSDLAGFESILRNVPWPVLQNPWLLKTHAYYFFEREWGKLNPSILVVVDPNGRVLNKNALPLVEIWGAEVYPFSEEKMKRLEQDPPEEHMSEYILNALFDKWSN